MTDDANAARVARLRREPPRFRTVAVTRIASVTPRLLRLTFTGPELDGFALGEPAASVRLLLPPAGRDELVMPEWNGNEFLLPDGTRPAIRTFTPLRFDAGARELDVEVVLHGVGRASEWAADVTPGAAVAISGPGRGYSIAADAPAFLLGGDETAIPAIGQLLGLLPAHATVDVHMEIATPEAQLDLAPHPHGTVTWHRLEAGASHGDALVTAVEHATIPTGAHIWVAGEAAAVQRVRRHLFDERSIPRSRATVRGYWKHGRAGDLSESS